MEDEILSALTRYVDRYGWSWNMAHRLINRTFGTEYTEKQLKKLYRERLGGNTPPSISAPPQA